MHKFDDCLGGKGQLRISDETGSRSRSSAVSSLFRLIIVLVFHIDLKDKR